MKPYHKSREQQRALACILQKVDDKIHKIQFCTYAPPFGVIPLELDEVYPLSQHQIAYPLDLETLIDLGGQVANYIKSTNCKKVIVLEDKEIWTKEVEKSCKAACTFKNMPLRTVQSKKPWSEEVLNDLLIVLEEALAEF